MKFVTTNSLVLLFTLLVRYLFSFFRMIVILAFSLAKISFPFNNTSISRSSPSLAPAYSCSSVTFASSFNSFKILDQSLLHFSSKAILVEILLAKSSASLSSLSSAVSNSLLSIKPFAASIYFKS